MINLVVLVTGTRHATPAAWNAAVHGALALQLARIGQGNLRVIHGMAFGIDSIAHGWALRRRSRWPVTVEAYPADWDRHGRAAGPIRNEQMRDRVLALQRDGWDVVILAFSDDITQSEGTAGMCRLASAAGLPVTVYGSDGVGREWGANS